MSPAFYCSNCAEHVAQEVCPFCDEPSEDFADYCERVEMQRESYADTQAILAEAESKAWAFKNGRVA